MEEQILFAGGMYGYASFRIPALCKCLNGDIIAFAEGRKNSECDYGYIDIVQRRSTDGGKSWSEAEVVCSDGANTYGNPCPICDRSTGAVCLVYCYNDADGGEKRILAGEAKRRVYKRFSYDNGVSWSAPEEITAEVMIPDWTWYATGPCHGIQLSGGRYVIPCNHAEKGSLKIGETKSHLIYSDDGGVSWHIGAQSGFGTNEATVCETESGLLYLNMRSNRFGLRRAYAVSCDLGMTLEPVKQAQFTDPYCQGSVYRTEDGRLYFTNCNSEKRERLTLYTAKSVDEWQETAVINEGPCAYSDICESGNALLIMYEAGAESPYEMIKLTVYRS